MLLKAVNEGGRTFEIRLDTKGNVVLLVEINRDGEEEGSMFFDAPFEMSRVGTALVEMSVRWKSLRG